MRERPPSSEIPDAPGVYRFRDEHGRVLYVGKAKSLRKRLANYFARDLEPRTRVMVDTAESVDWIVTENEVEALMLEFSLAQEHQPRFNIRLRDDKSFPYLAITRSQEWPRAMVMRGRRRRGVQYFGPYAHAYAIRQTLDLLLRSFPVRTCTDAKFKRHAAQGRPCLLYHIERCAGPCVEAVDADTYAEHVDGLAGFLEGDTKPTLRRLERAMRSAAQRQEYELAARYRDQLAAVQRATERQELVTEKPENFDVVAFEEDELEFALVVLNIRRGRVTGQRAVVIDRVEDVTTSELVGVVLLNLYGREEPPKSVLVQELPDEPEVWREWLGARRGSAVSLRVPQRGGKRKIMDTARANARETFARHRLRRQSDHNARAQALNSLQQILDLPEPPLRIECFDISTIQGSDTVGSMVVFEDGLAKKSDYRRFRVKELAGQDDFAAMEEVLRRRFTAYLAEMDLPVEERGRFSYPPSLVVVDGGAGQLARATKVLADLGLDIPAVGLAKKLEEVYLPGAPEPLRIPRSEEALYLLQRVRDEAHRFAVAYHRTLRSKRMVDSILDSVPGIGSQRKKALLTHFGSLKRMRAAGKDDLAAVVPDTIAGKLYEALHEA